MVVIFLAKGGNSMHLIQVRYKYSQVATLSTLLIEGKFFCYCLEDVVRPDGAPKVYGQSAIPAGLYDLQVTFSHRFQKLMPLILSVPGFTGIRMHGGNTAQDTDGCIIVAQTILNGDDNGNFKVANSASNLLIDYLGSMPHTIEIVNTSGRLTALA